MKTILFVTNNYHPYAGGVVKSIDSFAQALREQGYRVFIITLDFTGQGENEPWVIRLRCFLRFSYKNNPMAIPWRPSAQLKKIIQELKPDIIHVQHPFFLGYKAAIIAQRMQIPCVFTYHTLYEEYAHYAFVIPKSWIRAASISFCNRVDRVIAPSMPIYNYLMHYGVKTPITVISSPLRPEFLYNNQPKKVAAQRFRLLYVGRFVQEKNLYTLLDVIARLPRDTYELTLIGYGHEEQALKRYAYTHHGLSKDEVLFMHKPAQEIIKRAYQDADFFIFTSYTDTQGLVLAEAMAAGTPVIALEGPGQRDIIKQGENGFIAENIDAMVREIEHIRRDPELHERMQKAAFNAAQRYTPQVCVARLIEVYQGLIGR